MIIDCINYKNKKEKKLVWYADVRLPEVVIKNGRGAVVMVFPPTHCLNVRFEDAKDRWEVIRRIQYNSVIFNEDYRIIRVYQKEE